MAHRSKRSMLAVGLTWHPDTLFRMTVYDDFLAG